MPRPATYTREKGLLARLLLLQLAAVVVGVPGVVGEGHRHGHGRWLLLLEGFSAAIAAGARARRGRGLAARGQNVRDALRRCLHAIVRLPAQSLSSQPESCEDASCRVLGFLGMLSGIYCIRVYNICQLPGYCFGRVMWNLLGCYKGCTAPIVWPCIEPSSILPVY